MRHYIISFLMVAAVALAATAQSEPVELARLAEKIRSGEIDVGTDYSMNDKTGRFHIIHADKLLMDCSNCHIGEQYHDDYLVVGKQEDYPPLARGRLERSVCLGCHQAGGFARQLYQGSAWR